MKGLRIGYGEDIHRLVEGRDLILGGIKIPYEKGLLGHSDADCVLHALSDALLGAKANGDIGIHFPDKAEETLGMDSGLILKKSLEIAETKSEDIHNIDICISAEKPRLSPYIPAMRERIANLLGIGIGQVSVKAMTNEGLDAVGRGEAIRATAVVLVEG